MIGVFDSGLGGLTVLRTLAQRFPDEDFYYLGDTARLPYGSKSPRTIRQYSEQILNFLSSEVSPRALVVACNSASSQLPESQWKGVPLFNVIDPGVRAALQTTHNAHIGLLATRATVLAGVYEERLLKAANEQGLAVQVFAQPAPLLVPLAEEGWIDDPITNLIVNRYVDPLKQKGIDTLILGCTHYPILRKSLERVAGNSITLIESGQALAEHMNQTLAATKSANPAKNQAQARQIHIALTDASPFSNRLAESLLSPLKIDEFSTVDL